MKMFQVLDLLCANRWTDKVKSNSIFLHLFNVYCEEKTKKVTMFIISININYILNKHVLYTCNKCFL
jgi:hypothetical protein